MIIFLGGRTTLDIPLCQSEHKPQLLLNDPAALPLYHRASDHFAGALAPDAAACDAWAEELSPLPVGLALDCPPEPDAEHCDRPITMHYIEQCKEAFRPQLHEDAAFYYLRKAPTFPALRAAVLALGDLCGRTVIAELNVGDDEGRLHDGTDVRAAIGVLQRIGVTTVLLTARDPESLTQALEIAAPYARLSLGVCMKADWVPQTTLFNTEVIMPDDTAAFVQAMDSGLHCETLPRDHDDFICAPDGTHAHFIDPTIDISDEIECGPHLDEDLIEAEDDSGAFKLLLETEDDIITLEESRYMISRPLCLCAESADLLEQGLRVFPGLALYDGTWEQEEAVISYFETKYGMIRL